MDPFILLYIFIALMGSLIVREAVLIMYPAKTSGSIAISAGEDYDRRWEDPDYVAMTHSVIAKEKEEFGEARTVCECRACSNPPTGCGFLGCGRAGCENMCQGAKPRQESNIQLQLPSLGRGAIYLTSKEGYSFRVPDYVPNGAKVEYSQKAQIGYVSWYSADGKLNCLKVLPEMDFGPAESYEVWADDYNKPIRTYTPKRLYYKCALCGVDMPGSQSTTCFPCTTAKTKQLLRKLDGGKAHTTHLNRCRQCDNQLLPTNDSNYCGFCENRMTQQRLDELAINAKVAEIKRRAEERMIVGERDKYLAPRIRTEKGYK